MYNSVREAQKGDKESICRLIDDNLQTMYKIAWTYLKNDDDIADAIQDTICACFEKIHQLKKTEFFRTWLIRILINKCKDILMKKDRMIPFEILPEERIVTNQYSDVEWKTVMGQLADEYQTIMLLYYVENYSVRDIAELLELNENTVKSRLMRGRKQLLQILEG